MQHTKTQLLGFYLLLLCIGGSQAISTVTTTDYTIVETYTLSGTLLYTEGLTYVNATTLVESGGLYGSSSINLISYPSMKVLKTKQIGAAYFGEGCVPLTVNGVQYIYQMTWQEKTVFVWKASDLSLYKTIPFPATIGEGWGLTKGSYTSNGKTITAFYISNGSHNLFIVDPSDFAILKTVTVKKASGVYITEVNELEWINGLIWANIYMTNQVALIDPVTGYVDTIIDFSKLETLAKAKAAAVGVPINSGYVLNGIAYDEPNNRVLVTGKKWPLMWQIKYDGI